MTNILSPSEIGRLLKETADPQNNVLSGKYNKAPFQNEVGLVAETISGKCSVEACRQYLRDDEHARAVVGAVVASVEFAYQDNRIHPLDHIRYSLIGVCLGIGVDLSLIRARPELERVP